LSSPLTGWKAQLAQIGLSHVPDFFPGTFQSQSRFAGRPQEQRWRRREEQTIAVLPPGRVTWSQVTQKAAR